MVEEWKARTPSQGEYEKARSIILEFNPPVPTPPEGKVRRVGRDLSGVDTVVQALALGACLVLAGSGISFSDTLPLGPEFVVNTTSSRFVDIPAVAVAPAGNFLVFWEDQWQPNPIDYFCGVRVRAFGADGTPQGNDLVFSQYSMGWSPSITVSVDIDHVSAAACPSGDFVVGTEVTTTSQEVGLPPESWNAVFWERSSASGAPLGHDWVASGSQSTNTWVTGLSVAAVADSGFLTAWGHTEYLVSSSVWIQRFTDSGTALGPAVVVGDGYLDFPAVAVSQATGDHVVVWSSLVSVGNDTSGTSIQGRHFLADGTPGLQLQINTDTIDDQRQPVVAPSPIDYGHVVVWTSSCDIRSQAFREDFWGEAAGAEVVVFDGSTSQCAANPAVATMADGSYQVVWDQSDLGDSLGPWTIRGQRVTSDGVPLGAAVDISTQPGRNTQPKIAATPNNGFVVVWRYGTTLPDRTIRGRRFVDETVFFDGFESGDPGRWSALVLTLADQFNQLVAGRGISGAYIVCSYDPSTATYSYLGTVFPAASGGLGGAPITDLATLYWKNEHLASTESIYSAEDADGDGTINSSDSDALNHEVW